MMEEGRDGSPFRMKSPPQEEDDDEEEEEAMLLGNVMFVIPFSMKLATEFDAPVLVADNSWDESRVDGVARTRGLLKG